MSREKFDSMLPRAMFSPSPRTTLLLLFGLAGIVIAGGIRTARQVEDVRIDRERAALQRFSFELQTELQRLEALYETHLHRLARSPNPENAFEMRTAAERLVGIRQYSLLRRYGKTADVHIQVIATPGERTPVPMFELPKSGTNVPVLLDKERLFNGEGLASGWIDEPGKPLMFWEKISSTEAVVLMIDSTAVEKAVSGWLQSWAPDSFEPVRAGGGPDQMRTRDGQVLLAEGQTVNQGSRPDLLLPLRSRLGSWELASWDRRETRVHYNEALLTGSGALAVIVALLALLISGQQRREAALAAQRVSFVNRVSHELRSPLTNIVLNIDLATEALAEVPPEANRRLALVQEETRRLGRLIDNVLTFSRHEQGKLRAEPRACIPANVVAAVVEQFAPSFARRGLEVHCVGQIATSCLLDADALAQVLANLLSNVEKYVPGGVVEIASSLDDERLVLTVADQGPGIPSEATERIFRPFERLHSRVNEGVSGTGLGLAIARDLADTMGGSLTLQPSARGARFELRVPAPTAAPLQTFSAA